MINLKLMNKRSLKVYNTQNDYNTNYLNDLDVPHVVFLEETQGVIFKDVQQDEPLEPEVDYSSQPFTLVALEDGEITFTKSSAIEEGNLMYSIDGSDWEVYNTALSVSANQKVQWKGTKEQNSTKLGQFSSTMPFNAEGNVMSLVYGDNFETQTSLKGYNNALINLFKGSKIVSAKNLILPATTLAYSCYQSMFQGCTSLTEAPSLPATTLALSCYYSMFEGCTSLTEAPSLPATTLANNCYDSMFRNCTSLTSAPELKATTLANGCYYSMFYGCSSLTEAPELKATTLAEGCYGYMFYDCKALILAPELPATTLAERCYQSMFQGCTSLTEAPELKATTLTNQCYYSMFRGCTSLTEAPELPATTLAPSCYYSMFYGCSTVSKITMLATDISASNCLRYWVDGVASSGAFIKNPSTTSLPSGTSGIPNGWVVENITPYIVNPLDTKITFNYTNGLYTPTAEVKNILDVLTPTDVLSLEPECDIEINIVTKNDATLALNYLWKEGVSFEEVLSELNITNDINDLGIHIVNVKVPEGYGYYYYGYEDYGYEEETNAFVEKDWMRIVSLEDGNEISIDKNIQYSINGADWEKMNYNTITVNTNDVVYFKGTELKPHFTSSKQFNAEGNVMSLLFGNNFETQTDLSGKDNALSNLFYESKIVSAKNLTLPATTLASYCYYYMFAGCTSLTSAPELPATTLAERCYTYMFQGCTSLTKAPELPATTLAQSCYTRIFEGCTSLTSAPELPATTLANNCYQMMFSGCTSLTSAPELPATTLADGCYFSMFGGCKALTEAPELPATTLATSCYQYMFLGCTSLTEAPELPATTLTQSCYYNMFGGCSKLSKITMLATDISASYCLSYWVNGVASSGTFIKSASMTSLPSGSNGIPQGWTVQDYQG